MRPALVLATALFASLTTHSEEARALQQQPNGTKASGLDPAALKEIDEMFERHVESSQVSGMVALIAKDGETGYFKAYGMSDIDAEAKMGKDAIFRIYSMTKPIVSAVALSLWEEGKFKLDDPISKHLPEWGDAKLRDDEKPDTPITPRHLMTHTSGLSYAGAASGRRLDQTLKQFSEALAKRPLEFQPGTLYRYGLSIDILGRYVEAIEGKPLDEVVRERLLNPLGMEETDFWIRDESTKGRIAQVYNRNSDGKLRRVMNSDRLLDKPSKMMGGQGMVSTTEDYAKFCQMLLNGGELNGERVLKKSSVDQMFKNHLEDIGGVYGLGGVVGDGTYSWGGAAGTQFWVDRKNGYYAVLMIQAMGYNPTTKAAFRRLATKAAASQK